MNRTITISVIALIAIVMVIGIASPAMAKKDNNKGNNGCENANPNAKACEKNPNADPTTCQDCLDELYSTVAACEDAICRDNAYAGYRECIATVPEAVETCEEHPPAPGR